MRTAAVPDRPPTLVFRLLFLIVFVRYSASMATDTTGRDGGGTKGRLDRLLANNRGWAERMRKEDPEFFSRLSKRQSPEYLWIGCADSRVPANQIVDLLPGDIFVHRNVANVVVQTDLNCLSVLQYAVEVLEVKHVIVCGHYDCGGVTAALRDGRLGLIDNWLRHVQDVYKKHFCRMTGLESESARCDRLCELNVIEQAANVCRSTIVQDAWSRNQDLTIHGWIYDLADGILRELGVAVSGPGETEAACTAAIENIANR